MPSLGQIRVDGFEQDVTVNDRHQSFAAELLRLALLGVGGVGYVAAKGLPGADARQAPLHIGSAAKWLVLMAAVSFGVSAAAALALRYVSAELLALQLRIVRLRIRNDPHDPGIARASEARRNRGLKASKPLLVAASAFLVLGAGIFIAFLFMILGP